LAGEWGGRAGAPGTPNKDDIQGCKVKEGAQKEKARMPGGCAQGSPQSTGNASTNDKEGTGWIAFAVRTAKLRANGSGGEGKRASWREWPGKVS